MLQPSCRPHVHVSSTALRRATICMKPSVAPWGTGPMLEGYPLQDSEYVSSLQQQPGLMLDHMSPCRSSLLTGCNKCIPHLHAGGNMRLNGMLEACWSLKARKTCDTHPCIHQGGFGETLRQFICAKSQRMELKIRMQWCQTSWRHIYTWQASSGGGAPLLGVLIQPASAAVGTLLQSSRAAMLMNLLQTSITQDRGVGEGVACW